MFALALLSMQAAALPKLDGTLLHEGAFCYTIASGSTQVGVTWQSVRASVEGDRPAWDVTVHQRLADGSFDLRDTFVLERDTLQPIRMTSFKSGKQHALVSYSNGVIATVRPDKPAGTLRAAGRVWDGNLWGLTFAALPLAEGAHFELPMYQYDKGLFTMTVDVVGTEDVDGRAAWVLEADPGNGRKTRYLIAQDNRQELGYSAGPFGQRQGGDCSALASR